MATAKAWGSITLVDTTDIGQFSVTPSSNVATTLTYSPDNNTYSQNWASTNGIITPVIYYGGSQLTPGTTSGLTVNWTYKTNGDTSFTTLPSWAKPQTNGTLKLTANPFTTTDISTITFLCTANYNEPATNLPLTAAGEITYSIARQPASIPSCSISGESVFKYNTSQALVGPSQIVLTVANAHCSITKWQYKNSSGNWADIASTATSMTITPTSSYFVGDVCTLKVVTNVSTLYDIHTITKLRDGVPGQSTIAAVLTNEDQIIPCNKSGTPVTNAFLDAVTQLLIYRGGNEESSGWTIALSASDGITYQKSTDGSTWKASTEEGLHFTHVKITGMTVDVGSVTFTATKSSETTLIKKFSLSKVKTGADGAAAVSYILELSSNIVHVDKNNVVQSGNIVASLYKRTGNGDRAAYSGRLKILDAGGTQIFVSPANESVRTFGPTESILSSVVSNGKITVEMYAAGGTTTLLDTQSIVLVKDGDTGATGPKGNDGTSPINVVLGNYSDTIATSAGGTYAILPTNTAKVLQIPFTAYEGTSQVACSVTADSISCHNSGGSAKTVAAAITNATTTASGLIKYTFAAGDRLLDANATKTLTFTFTVTRKNGSKNTVVAYYTYSRSATGATGASPWFGYINTPNGNVLANNTGTVTLEAHLYNGGSDYTSNASTTYQWYKYTGSSYAAISNATSKNLTVQASDIDSYASYKCDMKYSNTLQASSFVSVFDKTDPIQVSVVSTVGDKFVNGLAWGAVFVKVFRNGQEIDSLPTEDFRTTAPASPTANQQYWLIDKANRTVSLMKYVSSKWTVQTYTPSGTYQWYFRNKNGEVVTPTGVLTTGKVIYIDGDAVDIKLQLDVSVEI